MTQLRLASVNLKIVSRRTKPSFEEPEHSPQKLLPSVGLKAVKLHALRPGAAAVIEELIDELLAEIA